MGGEWELNHVGFVVKDLDRAINYYEQLGICTIGPERVLQTPYGGRVNMRFIRIGSVEIEFLQPVEGEGPSSQFLKKHGEGINHLAFTVRDIDREVEKLKSSGGRLLFRTEVSGSLPGSGKVAYFDTGEIAGVLIELNQPTSHSAKT